MLSRLRSGDHGDANCSAQFRGGYKQIQRRRLREQRDVQAYHRESNETVSQF